MRRSLLNSVILALSLAAMVGCVQQTTEPGMTYQYIRTLRPAPPNRTYGQYPGVPNEAGIIAVRVVGKGVAPAGVENKAQAQLLAERAAVLDGYRQLAEKIRGIYISAYAGSDKSSINADVIRAETETWLRGAEVMEIRNLPSGIAEANLRALVQLSPDLVIHTPDRVVYTNEQITRVETVNPSNPSANGLDSAAKTY